MKYSKSIPKPLDKIELNPFNKRSNKKLKTKTIRIRKNKKFLA